MRPKDKLCIFLVRHGQTDWNVQRRIQGSKGVPLNKQGVKQAKELAKKFKRLAITCIHSSPVQRARQTAEIIAKPHNLRVKYEKDFRERGFGVIEGYTWEDFRKRYPHLPQQEVGIDWRAPKGESLRQTMRRVLTAFKKVTRKHPLGDRVLIVSHGSALRCLIHQLHGGKPEDFWDSKSLDNAEIVEVHWDGKKFNIVSSYG
jgi:broad specificity phosphatase PhoE